MTSPYEVLGVDPDADEAELLEAYRQRVKETHPDQGGSVEQFQAVRDAYEQLRSGAVPDDGTSTDEPRKSGSDETPSEPDTRPKTVTVEYLDYEVLDDRGWSLADDGLFERARRADLDAEAHGQFTVEPGETLLEAAENNGFAWPFACRGGACTNCAVAIVDGEMPPPVGHILPDELIRCGIRLSCLTAPITRDAKVVYNVKHMPDVAEFLLPASRFEKTYSRRQDR
ncbi:ferredoxin Fer [Halapricum desulfuricans]|uniref:DnaJ-like chaperone fused to ferredoxin n=1 Tax=Halapricum desulfuricans TaxID=2841257 RepID=A0A897N111_9EURY|nr:ferredoxin Fer [Halapricum desulfuricans]QSG06632.1 DnaJ-like chaperone fused to ferredoxin [Halapricum desulfuricans]